jgi:hypothetical protein
MNANHKKGPSFRALSDKNERWRTAVNKEWCPGKDGQRYSNPNGLSPGEGESGTFDRKQLFSALPSPRKSAGPNEQPRAPPVLQSPFARSSVHYRQREDEQDEENSASGSESKKNLIRGKGLDPHVCLAWLREAPSENNLGCWKFRPARFIADPLLWKCG